jgi:hypothetical protein
MAHKVRWRAYRTLSKLLPKRPRQPARQPTDELTMEKGDPNKNKKKNNMNDKNWFTNNTSVINIITNMYIYIYILSNSWLELCKCTIITKQNVCKIKHVVLSWYKTHKIPAQAGIMNKFNNTNCQYYHVMLYSCYCQL